MRSNEIEASPVSSHCKKIWESREHAVIGISLFSRYFSEDRISVLAKWAGRNFKDFHLFIPDVPSKYTLEALGYSPEKAAHKTRRQANYLKNKTTRALGRIGLTDNAAEEKIIDWEKLERNPVYTSLLSEYKELFKNDTLFRNGCMATSEWVLENNVSGNDPVDRDQVALAVNYFLSEIPLFFNSPEIFKKSSSVFCYHKIPELLSMMYNHRFLDGIHPGQGFVVLTPKNHNSKF